MYAIKNLIFHFNMCKKDDLYRNVIEKILCNLDKLGDATIYEWANICFASPTTISRLSRKLGYANFSSFKIDLMSAYEAYKVSVDLDAENDTEDMSAKMVRYFAQCRISVDRFVSGFDIEKAQKIVDTIRRFDQVRLYSTVFDTSMVELQENLLLDGKDAVMLNVVSEQIEDVQSLTKNVVAVLHISALNNGVLLSGIHQVIMEIKKRGATLIIISDSPQPNFMNYADLFYSFNGDSYIMLQQQYDMFIHGLSIIYRAKCLEVK